MKFLSLLTVFAAAVASSIAAETQPTGIREFYLKTKRAGKPEYNDHYVFVYGLAQGLGMSMMTKKASEASLAYLNDTYVVFPREGWEMYMGESSNPPIWEPVQLRDYGYGDYGFHITDKDLFQWRSQSGFGGFGGWLVCHWSYGMPQLFWLNNQLEDLLHTPCSCSKVELEVIYKI